MNILKKNSNFSYLFLLILFYRLHATNSVDQSSSEVQKEYAVQLSKAKQKILVYGYCREYDISQKTTLTIISFLHNNLFKYTHKPLPRDLSGEDLSDFDFTDCCFLYTNLTNSNLAGVILTNTTCDYQKAFLENISQVECDRWYKNNLPKDLKSIAEVYTKLNDDTQKVKFLQIACGLSRLPFDFHQYKDTSIKDFSIKVYYWFSALLQLKKALGSSYGKQLVCSLQNVLENDINQYCWTTNFPQGKITIGKRAPHAHFDTYLKDFTSGLKQYKCKSKSGIDWYQKQIIKNIQGLAAAYPHLQKVALQQEACDIAHALSKSYQVEKAAFGHHYIVYQNRLMRFKKLVGSEVKDKIYYNCNYVL